MRNLAIMQSLVLGTGVGALVLQTSLATAQDGCHVISPSVSDGNITGWNTEAFKNLVEDTYIIDDDVWGDWGYDRPFELTSPFARLLIGFRFLFDAAPTWAEAYVARRQGALRAGDDPAGRPALHY